MDPTDNQFDIGLSLKKKLSPFHIVKPGMESVLFGWVLSSHCITKMAAHAAVVFKTDCDRYHTP